MDWAAFFSVAWQQAMLAMLPLFVWLRWTRGRWPLHRLRTWAALFGASLSAWLVTPEHGDTPFLLYALICLAGAAIVRIKPAGPAQRAISIIFAIMAAINGGLIFAGVPHGGEAYQNTLHIAGWSQLVILFFWGCKNVGFRQAIGRVFHRVGRDADYQAGIGAGR